MLTYRVMEVLFCADTAWEINLNRNRQWFNELELGKVLCAWGSFKRFSLRWEVRERKNVLKQEWWSAKATEEEMGNGATGAAVSLNALRTLTRQLIRMCCTRETTKSCRKVLQVCMRNTAWSHSRYMSKGPSKFPPRPAQCCGAAAVAGACSTWEVQPEAVSPAAAPHLL